MGQAAQISPTSDVVEEPAANSVAFRVRREKAALFAKILQQMETISGLLRVGCAASDASRVEATPIAADKLNLRPLLDPVRRRLNAAGFQHVHHLAALEIHDDGSVGRPFTPAPVVDRNHAQSFALTAPPGMALQAPENRSVAGLHAKLGQQSFADQTAPRRGQIVGRSRAPAASSRRTAPRSQRPPGKSFGSADRCGISSGLSGVRSSYRRPGSEDPEVDAHASYAANWTFLRNPGRSVPRCPRPLRPNARHGTPRSPRLRRGPTPISLSSSSARYAGPSDHVKPARK